MRLNVKIDKKVFNDAYLPYLDCNTRNQIFFGGASAGKSIAIVGQRTIRDLLVGDRNYLILRNIGRTSRVSTFNEVRKTIIQWGLDDYFKINKSDMVITCINGYQILFQGLDDVEKIKSITPERGVITDILVEEATETAENDIKQLEKRLRGKSKVKKRITLLFNPILKTHWIFKKYFSGRFFDGDKSYNDGNVSILHTTYKDNRFLEQDDIDALENETDEYFRDVYTLGKWGTLGDVIFKNWRVEDLGGMVSQFDNIRNGLDFGFSSHPMAYNRCHYDTKKNGFIYLTKSMN